VIPTSLREWAQLHAASVSLAKRQDALAIYERTRSAHERHNARTTDAGTASRIDDPATWALVLVVQKMAKALATLEQP
jgi:hypothetical protein